MDVDLSQRKYTDSTELVIVNGDSKDQTIADLRAQLKQAEEERDSYKSIKEAEKQILLEEVKKSKELSQELDEAVENLEVLGQQQMDDFKAHKAEVDRYRKAVEPAKEADAAAETASIPYSVQDPFVDMARIQCAGAIKNCVRILGEAGNDKS